MAELSLAYLGRHEPLTGDPQERFYDLTSRLGGSLAPGQTQTSADCPSCFVPRCLSITYDQRGVAIWCNGRTEYRPDGCDKAEILGVVGVWLSDLKVVPPARDDLWQPRGYSIPLRPELVALSGSVEGALVLQQILYWSPRGGMPPYDGRRWIAKHHAELAGEIGIDAQKLRKTIIPALVAAGFIVTRDGSFQGKRCPWYSVNKDAVDLALALLDEPTGMLRSG